MEICSAVLEQLYPYVRTDVRTNVSNFIHSPLSYKRLYKFSSYHTYEDELLMLVREIITVYSEYRSKPTNTLCKKNAEFLKPTFPILNN
jgi:hypothetical protein